jgi:hypothetical protein
MLGILSIGVLTKIDVHACGDKLLLAGRGVRYALIHPGLTGSILLYKNPSLPKDSRIRDPKLSAALKGAGHKLTVATELNELTTRLKSGKYDLVIADPSDVPAVTGQLQAAPSKPLLLSLVLPNAKIREADYTEYVDHALKSRHK